MQLIDGPTLSKMIADVKRTTGTPPIQAEPPVHAEAPPEPLPLCPKCQSPMVLRTARRGPEPGSQFYGCSTWPACRGKRPLAAKT